MSMKKENKMEEDINFTDTEINAMKTMFKTFADMQSERNIDPDDYGSTLGCNFNNAMCALMNLMFMNAETENFIYECGY